MIDAPRRTRTQRDLTQQIQTVAAYLRDQYCAEDAAATASPGWRPIAWTPNPAPCASGRCRTQHDHSPHSISHRPWQSEIDARLDRWPRYLTLAVPEALYALPYLDRMAVELLVKRERSSRCAAKTLRMEQTEVSYRTLLRHKDQALEAICRAVWDDDGAPRYTNVT